MKRHKKEQTSTEAHGKPRFRIEKLEERIAPSHRPGHVPPGHADGCPPAFQDGYGGCSGRDPGPGGGNN